MYVAWAVGFDQTAQVSVHSPATGVYESTRTPLAIAPNPATDQINVLGFRPTLVQLFDANGRLVLETASSTLDVRKLDAGMYSIVAQNQNEIRTATVVVE